MRREKGKRYIIRQNSLVDILDAIIRTTEGNVQEIVYEGLMHRAIFKIDLAKQTEETSWIRIRAGDVDCDGQTGCTITFKRKNHSIDNTQMTELTVEDYYAAIDFFSDIGHELTSIQETRRTKYVFHYDGVKYVICFDEWPHIQDLFFVTVIPGDSASLAELDGVCGMIELDKFSEKHEIVDVDDIYKNIYGKPASDIPNVRFNMPICIEEDKVEI